MGSLTGVSGIVANVIAPLADCGVSVFCVSTNLDDFVLVGTPAGFERSEVLALVATYIPHKV